MKIENIVEEEKNSFLCSVMNSGFGRIILPLTLSSSLLLNSCASTSQSYDWREEPRTETKEEKILDERVISEGIRYDIQQEKIHNTNVIDIPVIEEKFEEKTVRKRIIEKARFDQYRIVTTKKSSASTSIGLGVILSLGIGLLGSLVGSTITNWSSKEEQNKAATQGFYVGAGAGFMIGLIVGATKNDFKEWDSNSYRTGTSETRTLIDKIVTENQDFIISSISKCSKISSSFAKYSYSSKGTITASILLFFRINTGSPVSDNSLTVCVSSFCSRVIGIIRSVSTNILFTPRIYIII